MGPEILPETIVSKHNPPCHLQISTKALSCKKEAICEHDPEALSCPVGQGSFKLTVSNGAFPLRGMTLFSTARYGTARFGRFAFPLQFSAALEWAGLFTCRYSCAASTAVTSS